MELQKLTDEEIKQEVYRVYPKCEDERHCRPIREYLKKKREELKIKLEQARENSGNICEEIL